MMSDLTYVISEAHPGDAAELTRICRAAKMHWQYPPAWLELWEETLTVSEKDFHTQRFYKLCINGDITGFCGIEPGSTFHEITHLWIKPEHIGKGFGTKLLRQTIKAVVKKDTLLRVVADPNAVPFYRKQGFVTSGKQESLPAGRFLPVLERELHADEL